jgi:hypothetical protein
MPGVHSYIRAAIREKLQTLAGLPPVAWEGYPYEPVIGTTYFRETLNFQDSQLTSLGRFGRLKHEGVWMVDVYTPGGKGTALADDWADKLTTLFAAGVTMTKTGTTVRITRAFAGPAQHPVNWVMRPCMIDWFTESTNPV